ncbi:MAG: PfkB family carbohydrate kinase [Patescibacteria group bacterium]
MLKQNKKYDLVVIGGATRDILFYSKEGELISTNNIARQRMLAFEYGAKIYADRVFTEFGGGAVNVAVGGARLGLRTAVICRVGNDQNGREVIENLKEKKVDVSLVKIDRSAVTGFSIILTINNPAKEHVALLHRGANEMLSASDLALGKLKTEWFYLPALPKVGWEKIMEAVIRQKVKVAWNPGRYQLEKIDKIKKFLPQIKLLIVNRDEALEFRKLKEIKGLLKHIKSLGPELVVITDGAKGAYVYDGKKYYFMKAASVKNINTIGVGDAFGAGFTSALIYGKNIKQALRWGIINSAAVVSNIGAQKGLLNLRQIK